MRNSIGSIRSIKGQLTEKRTKNLYKRRTYERFRGGQLNNLERASERVEMDEFVKLGWLFLLDISKRSFT